MRKALNNMPWQILLPIVLVMGFGISIWGGLELDRTLSAGQQTKLVLQSEHQLAQFQARWAELGARLMVFESFQNAGHPLEERDFKALSDSVTAEFPAVQQVTLFSGQVSRGYKPLYSYSVGTMVPPGDVSAIVKQAWQDGFATPTLHLLPSAAESKNTLSWAVKMMGKGQTIVAVRLDLNKFLRSILTGADKTVPVVHLVLPATQTPVPLLGGHTKPNEQGFDYATDVETGGVRWSFLWQYPSELLAPARSWGKLLAAAGLLMTLMLVWALWNQHSVAQRVRHEVVQRTKELEQASRRFRLITDNAYDLIAILTATGDFDYVNSAYNRVLGFSRRELANHSVLEFVHEDDLRVVRQAFDAVVGGQPVAEVSFRMRNRKNEWVYLEAVAKGLYDSNWNLNGVVLHCRDVTSRKQDAENLARSEQRFRDFADSSADWLWEVDESFNFTYVSPGVKGTLGYLPEEMMGKSQFEAFFAASDDSLRDLLENLAQRHQPYRDLEFWTRTKMGERVCLRLSGMPVFDGNGQFGGYRGAATNVTASKIDQENMLRLATTDHLTGLLNRNRFMEELDRTVALSRRHNTTGALLFIDLDRFKAVNDTHGHDAGDEIIRQFSAVLKKTMRSTDIVARLGGDEFAVIMHNVDLAQAQQKVQRLIDRVNSMRVNYKAAKLHVTMSVGMVGYPQAGKDGSQMMTSADLAMYRAKDMGRNRMYVDAGITDASAGKSSGSVREQLEWIDRLRDALANDTFEMHFQPIVPCEKGTSVIYEALIRLRDEEGKLGAPALFIDAAEHFGIINDLDRAVVERCIKTHAELVKQGVNPTFSINLSGMSFGDKQLLETMKRLFKQYKVDPGQFIFEVTETVAMRDLDDAKMFVKELKRMGSQFALDDFGVGFSSFMYIKHLDVDFIKIDGSYIKHLHESAEDRLFVKSLVDLAAGLGISTVAEFVENADILTELKKMDVTYVQGYHLSRPDGDIAGLCEKFEGTQAGAA